MITLGMDPHPGSRTVAALDCNGSLLGSIRVPNTSAGLGQLHHFASRFASGRWAIEGAGYRFVAQFVKELLASPLCLRSWIKTNCLRRKRFSATSAVRFLSSQQANSIQSEVAT